MRSCVLRVVGLCGCGLVEESFELCLCFPDGAGTDAGHGEVATLAVDFDFFGVGPLDRGEVAFDDEVESVP